MKGIVNTFLNERVKEPSVNAANPVYYEPGDVVEIVDILNGQEYDGNKVWYQLDNGAYVWSGGVQGTYEIDQEIQDQGRHSEVFNTVPGTGKGIGIAILDSGINVNHVHLSKRVKLYESYLEGKVKDNITDHGTLVAGVIASDDSQVSRNKSNLYCLRVADERDFVDNYAVKLALEDINKKSILYNNVHLVNLSLDLMSSYISRVQPVIEALLAKGILSIVAAGEDVKSNKIAALNNVIRVGVFNQSFFSKFKAEGIPREFDVALLNVPIPSYKSNGEQINGKIQDDSAYCAYVTSLIAKDWSNSLPQKADRYISALEYLKQNSIKISNPDSIEPFKLYT